MRFGSHLLFSKIVRCGTPRIQQIMHDVTTGCLVLLLFPQKRSRFELRILLRQMAENQPSQVTIPVSYSALRTNFLAVDGRKAVLQLKCACDTFSVFYGNCEPMCRTSGAILFMHKSFLGSTKENFLPGNRMERI